VWRGARARWREGREDKLFFNLKDKFRGWEGRVIKKKNTYKRCAHGFDWTQGFRMSRRHHNILHETIAFNTEAKGGPVGQAHDTHGRCDIRQCEREEMRDPQRRRHGQKVPELIPRAFLHLHETVIHQHSSRPRRGGRGEVVNLESGRCVGFHNFADVAS
jgi:hypothetical protein